MSEGSARGPNIRDIESLRIERPASPPSRRHSAPVAIALVVAVGLKLKRISLAHDVQAELTLARSPPQPGSVSGGKLMRDKATDLPLVSSRTVESRPRTVEPSFIRNIVGRLRISPFVKSSVAKRR
jgi:hypothetical protein